MDIFAALLVSSVCLCASVTWAAPIERSLPVSVFITANQNSTSLEIVADKHVFQTTYDTAIQSFPPLTVPFTVRSVTGQNVAYDLQMSHLGGQCDDGQPLNLSVTALSSGSPIVLNEKYRFAGIENHHGAVISFPEITQSDVTQRCSGHIGVVAGLAV